MDDELKRLAAGGNSIVTEVFAAHRLILQDQMLLDAVRAGIDERGLTAAGATLQAVGELAEQMAALEDDYFAGRASDVLDIGQRLLVALNAALRPSRLDGLPVESVLISDDITPSDVAQMQPGQIAGIAIAGGAPNAHASILARSLGIPMVCALGPAILRVGGGRPCIVDGDRGLLVVNPDAVSLRRSAADRQSLIEELAIAARHAHEPAITLDGVRVGVLANANSPDDVQGASASGAEGIGLLRTEFLFQARADTPHSGRTGGELWPRHARAGSTPIDRTRARRRRRQTTASSLPTRARRTPFWGCAAFACCSNAPEILRTQYRALQVAVR